MFRRFVLLPVLLLAGLSLTGFSAPLSAAAEREGTPWWVWLLIILVLMAFAIFVYGWWRRGSYEKGQEKAAPHVEPEAAAHAPAAKVEVAQAPEPAPPAVKVEEIAPPPMAPAEPDDLKLIEGIGPKISAVLQAAGILTFAQLADTSVDRLRQILVEANPNLLCLADPATWPEQASLAARGDWETFRQLQATLKGGRRV
jgi:predicted flap endonuclease-1-like 5' DNA nuclease